MHKFTCLMLVIVVLSSCISNRELSQKNKKCEMQKEKKRRNFIPHPTGSDDSSQKKPPVNFKDKSLTFVTHPMKFDDDYRQKKPPVNFKNKPLIMAIQYLQNYTLRSFICEEEIKNLPITIKKEGFWEATPVLFDIADKYNLEVVELLGNVWKIKNSNRDVSNNQNKDCAIFLCYFRFDWDFRDAVRLYYSPYGNKKIALRTKSFKIWLELHQNLTPDLGEISYEAGGETLEIKDTPSKIKKIMKFIENNYKNDFRFIAVLQEKPDTFKK